MIILLVSCTILLAVVAFSQRDKIWALIHPDSNNDQTERRQYLNAELKTANDALASGDFLQAASTTRKILAESDPEKDSSAYFNASSVLALSEFLAGSKEQRIGAIRLTKQNFLSQDGNARRQASEINILLGYIRSANEQYVFEEVFSGEPFQKFFVKDKRLKSIKNLAEYSYGLDTSTEALYRIADYQRSIVLNSSGALEKKKAIDATVQTLHKADLLYPRELAEVKGLPFDYMVELRYYLWESYIYGELALADPVYLDISEKMSDKMFNLYETRRDASGNKIALIAARVTDVYLNYARYLYTVKGMSRIDDVRSHLDSLIAVINEHPSWHQGSYLALVRKMATDGIAGKRSRSYQQYVELANIHEPFKRFLESYGWTAANFK